MSRAVHLERFGGPEELVVRDVEEPHPREAQARVHVSAIGLNPMDWMIAADPGLAAAFGISLPAGFGHDFAGVIDEITDETSGHAVGDRVFGSVSSRAAADHIIVGRSDLVFRTPDAITDVIASTLPVAGLTASAALSAVGLDSSDTLLVGGAAGGVGIFATQLARIAGARVIGTGSPGTMAFLSELGVEPIPYGADLAKRLARMPGTLVTAAIDLHGTETAHAALALGVPADRIVTIAAGRDVPPGVRVAGAHDANPAAMRTIMTAVAAGRLRVPIAATFSIENIRDAVALQATRHTHGKIVVTTLQ